MKKEPKNYAIIGFALLATFALWTHAIARVDVRPIGPLGAMVGFAGLNGWFHSLTGVHWWLYDLTDLLGLASLGSCGGFGCRGFASGSSGKASDGWTGSCWPWADFT